MYGISQFIHIYADHIQVSDRIIEKVLELIQQWTLTICETSKYKHDLRHILDMKKLLQYKG